ncbi:hypothetical protein V3481_009045 [Fusarium oxysporum f. sp. vasinfectum]
MFIRYTVKDISASQALAAVAALVLSWIIVTINRPIWFWQLQQKYGPTFRITPDSVLINTPTGLRTIFNNKANVKKAGYYKAYPHNVHAMTT